LKSGVIAENITNKFIFNEGDIMSDSKDTNELDSYGVWVKTPPKTVDSSTADTNQNLDDFNLDTDLPDFSDLDVIDEPVTEDYDNNDTALSAEELSAITGVTQDTAEEAQETSEITESSVPDFTDNSNEVSENAASDGGEEEISLDEFIEGGVFETGPDEDKIKEKEEQGIAPHSSEPQDSTETEDVDMSDFGVSADDENSDDISSENSEPAVSESSDDDIFNLDLSFDSDDNTEDGSSGFTADTFDTASTESNAASDAPDGTENVDLSEFGFDDISSDESPAEENTADEETASDSSSNEGMETIDLSEFGFDDTDSIQDTSSEQAQTETVSQTASEDSFTAAETADTPAEENTETSPSEETVSFDEGLSMTEDNTEETVQEDDFSVTADDDNPVLESDTVSSATPEKDFAPEEDSDFDVDSLLGNVTDENGNTVSIGKQEDAIVREVNDIPDEEKEETVTSESIEDLNIGDEETIDTELDPSIAAEIPDSFEEETSSFFDDSTDSNEALRTAEFADSIKAPILSEMEAEEEKPSTQMTAIFDQIVGELSSLKNEIASLKNDFEKMKSSPSSIDIPAVPQEESEGFFADTDEDDTIALSTDELDNILNTADISTADSQEVSDSDVTESTDSLASAGEDENSILGNVDSDIEIPEEDYEENNDFGMDFSETPQAPVDEPSLDDIDYSQGDETEEDSALPNDDILVESSSVDLMDSSDVEAQTPQEESAESVSDPFDELTKEDPPISASLTEDKLDYLEEKADESEAGLSNELTSEIKSVLSYMDQLLENLPEEKIAEFAQSEQFDTYKKLFKELGLA
jgi:hypothetical protein